MEFQLNRPAAIGLSLIAKENPFMPNGEQGFLSSPFSFDVLPLCKNSDFQYQYHQSLCKKFKHALMQNSEFLLSAEGDNGTREQITRVRISLNLYPNCKFSTAVRENEFHKYTCEKVKVRIFSDFPQNTCVEVKEQGLLTKLARILGETRASLKISWKINLQEDKSLTISCPTECTWNETTLSWEADTRLIARTKANQGVYGEYKTNFESLDLVLSDAALNEVLCKSYSVDEERSNFLRDLENEAFTDMVITGSNGVPIKCHRILVTGVSSVFAAMFNEKPTNLKESKTCSLEIQDMSEEGIRSMLRFIYCKDCMALCTSVDITLELLQAGQKYMMPNLVNVATVLLMTKPSEWYNVDSAVELFCFARNVNEDGWKDLMIKSIRVLQWFNENHQDQFNTSDGYNELFQKIYKTAKSLSPELLKVFGNETDLVDEVGQESKSGEESLSSAEELSKEDVSIMIDFVLGFAAEKLSDNVNILMELLLASYKFDIVPSSTLNEGVLDTLIAQPNERFGMNEAVALFSLSINANGDKRWDGIKLKSLEVLKYYHLEKRDHTLNSAVYKEMFRKDPQVATELIDWLFKFL